MFRRQLEEVELAERIGIDQIWFFEHHLQPTAPVPSPNLLIATASRTTRRIRFSRTRSCQPKSSVTTVFWCRCARSIIKITPVTIPQRCGAI